MPASRLHRDFVLALETIFKLYLALCFSRYNAPPDRGVFFRLLVSHYSAAKYKSRFVDPAVMARLNFRLRSRL